jgi:hypothetical protein
VGPHDGVVWCHRAQHGTIVDDAMRSLLAAS